MDLLRWNICNISHARSKYIDIQWWYNISTGAAAAAATRSIYYFYIHIRMLLKLPFRNVYTTRNEDRENKTNESQYFKGEATLENCCAFDRISYQQQRYMYTLEMIYIKNRNKEINARVIYRTSPWTLITKVQPGGTAVSSFYYSYLNIYILTL